MLPFRALLGRGVRVVEEPLVKYRVHGANLFVGQTVRSRAENRRWARSAVAISADWRKDWVVSGRDSAIFDRSLAGRLRLQAYDAECYDRSRAYALTAVFRGLGEGLTARNFAGLFKRHVLRL